MNNTDAARALSVNTAEIGSVEDSPAGVIVTTTDGVRYVIVPDDSPDAEGKTGLMFLAAPHENYGGSFPIYAQPQVDDVLDDDGNPDDGANVFNDPLGALRAAAFLTRLGLPASESKPERRGRR